MGNPLGKPLVFATLNFTVEEWQVISARQQSHKFSMLGFEWEGEAGLVKTGIVP